VISGQQAVTTQEPGATLGHGEPCDRCPGQAFVEVALVTGHLFFCAHHAAAFLPVLSGKALYVVDQRHRLLAPARDR
jgi:hypothetical protein